MAEIEVNKKSLACGRAGFAFFARSEL